MKDKPQNFLRVRKTQDSFCQVRERGRKRLWWNFEPTMPGKILLSAVWTYGVLICSQKSVLLYRMPTSWWMKTYSHIKTSSYTAVGQCLSEINTIGWISSLPCLWYLAWPCLQTPSACLVIYETNQITQNSCLQTKPLKTAECNILPVRN